MVLSNPEDRKIASPIFVYLKWSIAFIYMKKKKKKKKHDNEHIHDLQELQDLDSAKE